MNQAVFETMRSVNGTIPLWDFHHARLLRSSLETVPDYVDIASKLPGGLCRIRLSVDDAGWKLVSEPLGEPWDALRIGIWPEPFFNPSPSTKNSDRSPYEAAWMNRDAGCDDMLLLTEDGSVAETTRLNVFWMKDDTLFTADATCTPLSGVAKVLVSQWSPWPVSEGRYPLAHLQQASFVFGSNAVRGIVWFRQVGDKIWAKKPDLLSKFQDNFETRAYG